MERRTLFGKLKFYIGRFVALTFIVKLGFSAKNVVQPDYKVEMIDKVTKTVIESCHSLLGIGKAYGYKESVEGSLAVTIVIEYCILAIMALLIAFNVQSFLKKLLFTLKNILRDNEIQLSYHTTILYFSFIMGTYYFSILFQMSMQLPAAKQEPFA